MQNSAYKFSKFVYILYNQHHFVDTYLFLARLTMIFSKIVYV